MDSESSYRCFLDGDDEGLVRLIEEFKEPLTLYLCSITGNVFAAEELMEETFFRLASKKPRFSGRSSFKTWLYAIARNLAVDRLRREAKRPTAPLDEALASAELSSVEEEYLKSEEKIAVHRALARINNEYRQALWLSYFEELSNGEIARVTGKSKRQVENLLYRAKHSLRIELEKEGIGDEKH